MKTDGIVWVRSDDPATSDLSGWIAYSGEGGYLGTVFADGDLAFQGNLFRYGSQAIAAQALVFKANGVKR